jgi:hypothetical protein
MIGYNIMVSVEILTRCSYKTLIAEFVRVVKIRLFTVVLNSYAKITFLPKRSLLTYVLWARSRKFGNHLLQVKCLLFAHNNSRTDQFDTPN